MDWLLYDNDLRYERVKIFIRVKLLIFNYLQRYQQRKVPELDNPSLNLNAC